MGYIRHEAVVAIFNDWDEELIKEVEELKNSHEPDALGPPQCIVGPVKGVNGYISYAFLPDGSKEGWGASNEADKVREKFISLARRCKYPSFVNFQFGGDDGETIILETSDSEEP